jgi:hypothetical protein
MRTLSINESAELTLGALYLINYSEVLPRTAQDLVLFHSALGFSTGPITIKSVK